MKIISSQCFCTGRGCYCVGECCLNNNKLSFIYVFVTQGIKSLKTFILSQHNFSFHENLAAWWNYRLLPVINLKGGSFSLCDPEVPSPNPVKENQIFLEFYSEYITVATLLWSISGSIYLLELVEFVAGMSDVCEVLCITLFHFQLCCM